MPMIELVDETFVAADPAEVSAIVHDPRRWEVWWPDLTLTPFMDRDLLGIRWSAAGTRWHGSIEVWLEAMADGVLVHHYQRLDPVGPTAHSQHRVAKERADRALRWKRHAWALKDALETGRRPGTEIHPDGSRNATQMPTKGG